MLSLLHAAVDPLLEFGNPVVRPQLVGRHRFRRNSEEYLARVPSHVKSGSAFHFQSADDRNAHDSVKQLTRLGGAFLIRHHRLAL